MTANLPAATMTALLDLIRTEGEWCYRCQHPASRSSDPWDNQYRCEKGCNCTMQGCCPGTTRREA